MSIVLLNYYQNISTKKTNHDSSEKSSLPTNLLSYFKHAIINIARDLSCLFFKTEVIIMRRFYSHLPYYLVILFFYWPLYELFLLVVSDPLTLKELYINNLLFFTPLVILIVSLLYSYRFRFSL